jgi:hypothetical protein
LECALGAIAAGEHGDGSCTLTRRSSTEGGGSNGFWCAQFSILNASLLMYGRRKSVLFPCSEK